MTGGIMAATHRRVVMIVNPWGMHARSAMKFVRTALAFEADVAVSTPDTRPVDGKEVMALLTLGAPCGTALTIETTGADAEEAVVTLARLVEEGFDEIDARKVTPR